MNVEQKNSSIKIAIDAMGGDNAPLALLKGANIIAKNKKLNVNFIIFGDEGKINPILNNLAKLKAKSEIRHTEKTVAADEKASAALRKGRGTSMHMAIQCVKFKEADAIISCGNTGALMAMSKLLLRPIAGIDRPAIASVFPARLGKCVLLDLGANIDCSAENLVQFAIMGDAFAKVLLGIDNPTVGLLNVGSEETKGSDIVKTAAEEIREGGYSLNFYGYVEGNDITEGTTNVVVTDGFTGNVALKVAEGTGKICRDYMKQAFKSSPLAMIGGFLSSFSLKKTFKKMDPRSHNGAMFVGLNGIAVKSHGGSDDIGFANSILLTVELVKNDINQRITDELISYTNDIESTQEDAILKNDEEQNQ